MTFKNIRFDAPLSFSEKILQLSDGLRASGLPKYADDIERKFLLLKRAAANSLYDVSNETGEDLIDFAHPEGNKLLDKAWSELGTVETILEQHKKIVDIIQKKPKGKLAGKNILNAVKIVLANEEPNYDAKIREILAEGIGYAEQAANNLREVYNKKLRTEGISILTEEGLGQIFDNLKEAQTVLASGGELDYAKIMQITKHIDAIPKTLEISTGPYGRGGSFYLTSDEEGVAFLEQVQELVATAKTRCNAAFELLKGRLEGAQFQLGLGLKPSAISLDGAPTPKGTEAASDFSKKVQADQASVLSIEEKLQSLAGKPSIVNDPQKSAFVSAVQKAASAYSADLKHLTESLAALGNKPLSSVEITAAVQGTKFFAGVTSYEQFKETAQSFHAAVSQRLQIVQGW